MPSSTDSIVHALGTARLRAYGRFACADGLLSLHLHGSAFCRTLARAGFSAAAVPCGGAVAALPTCAPYRAASAVGLRAAYARAAPAIKRDRVLKTLAKVTTSVHKTKAVMGTRPL